MKIRTKLILSYTIIALLVAIIGFFGLKNAQVVSDLRMVELPMEQNLREVEVSIWEAIHAANAFRLTGDPKYEDLYYKQIGDVDEFFPKYVSLTTTSEEKVFIEKFNKLWNDGKVAGEKMIGLTKEQEKSEGELFFYIDKADDIIDFNIQAKWSRNDPNILAKEMAIREVEISIWESIHAAIQYISLSGGKSTEKTVVGGEETFKDIMYRQFADVEEFLLKYKSLAKTSWEKEAIAKFDDFWEDAVLSSHKVIELSEQSEKQFNLLYEMVDQADDIIDFNMQKQIQERIDKENEEARTTVLISIIITVIGFISALTLGFYISRSISNPITKLRDAAIEISHGNMDVKIVVRPGNEIGELAGAFDNMRTSLKIMMEKYDTNSEEKSVETR